MVVMKRLKRGNRRLASRQLMNQLLCGFVRRYDQFPGIVRDLLDGGDDIDAFQLAVWAGLMSDKEAADLRYWWSCGDSNAGVRGVYGNDLTSVAHEMVERGLLKRVPIQRGQHPQNFLVLTPDGIDAGIRLLRPWHIKMWDFMKGDVRGIIVAAVAAILTTIITTLVLRALGWV